MAVHRKCGVLAQIIFLIIPVNLWSQQFSKVPAFSVHHSGERQKWPQQKADMLFHRIEAEVSLAIYGTAPHLSIRGQSVYLENALLDFRPGKTYGYDCSTNTVWMPKWNEAAFAIGFANCSVIHSGHTMTKAEIDHIVRRAIVATNSFYFKGEE